jgi:hypothetical protein
MQPTRRDALLLASYVASRVAAAQPASGELVIRNKLGVSIFPQADGKSPSLMVSLPGKGKEIAAIIEMPEHAYRKRGKSGEPEWFYRMYTNDARVMGSPTWSRESGALDYKMSLPSGYTLNARAALDEEGITIQYVVPNPERVALTEVQAPTCIKLYHPFTDVFLERTYVHQADGLDLLASETPERLTKNAEEWLPCRYIVRCSKDALPPVARMERQSDGIMYYRKLRAADTPFLATESSPKGWVAATHSLDSPDVWTNPARTCHHADSGVPVAVGAVAKLSLKLNLLRGTVRDAWERVAARHRRQEL